MELFKKSIEVMGDKPETLIAYGNMGNCCERIGELERAADWYRRALKLFPDNRGLRSDLLRVCKKLEQYDLALYMAEGCYDKGTPRYLLEEGQIYAQMKKYDKAVSSFTCVIDMKSSNQECKKEAWGHLAGILFYYKKKPKKALEMYQKVLDMEEPDSDGYIRACRDAMECLAALGRQQEAAVYQQKAFDAIRSQYGSLEKYLENYYIRKSRLYEVGTLFYYAGDLENARKYFEQIGDAPRCRHCNYQICEDYWEAKGFLMEAEGNLPEALNCFREACRESKGNHLSLSKVEALTKRLKRRW